MSTNRSEIVINGIRLQLSEPDEVAMKWIGHKELVHQLKAAWLVLNEKDTPLNPRLLGKPGVGKTTLAYCTAKELNQKVYIYQATMDTRPEDLLVTPVISSGGQIKYAASPLVSAMITGGTVILDEANRMSEKSWASLAPLLDGRKYIESIVAGIKIKAHKNFRFCATMNDDASTFELPEYIHSRLQPQIFINFPEKEDEMAILEENLPFTDKEIIEYVTDFLQRAHRKNESYSIRDGINIARYAAKLLALGSFNLGETLKTAILHTLGNEAMIYVLR